MLTCSWNDVCEQSILYVFCHELAHIRYMNHVPSQHGALTRKLKQMALDKQRQGYFGDGFWSSGRQLAQGFQREGFGMHQRAPDDQLPNEVCGGAFRRAAARGGGARGKRRARSGRASGSEKRPRRKFQGPSLHTGAQTSRNLKPGTAARRVDIRVSATPGATPESSSRVDGRNPLPTASARDASYKLDDNSTFRKRTQSREAREKRAMAAMARLGQLGSLPARPKSEVVQVKLETMLAAGGSTASLGQISGIKEEGPSRTMEYAGGQRHAQAEEDSETEEEEEERNGAQDEDSETEDEEENEEGATYISDDDLDVLVGDDLGDGQQGGHTRGSRETQEQRQRLLERYRSMEQAEAGEGQQRGWAGFFDEDDDDDDDGQVQNSTERHDNQTHVKQKNNDGAEDDIELVGVSFAPAPAPRANGRSALSVRPTTTPSATPHNSAFSSASATKAQEWTCQLCTLVNGASQSRCAACETTRGKTTLGA